MQSNTSLNESVVKQWRSDAQGHDPTFIASTELLHVATLARVFASEDDVLAAYTYAWKRLKSALASVVRANPSLPGQIAAAREALPGLDEQINREWIGDEPSEAAMRLISERWQARHLDNLGYFIDAHLEEEVA